MLIRLYHDFWPPDQGVAANILASFICFLVASVATYLVWPQLRRAVDAWVKRHLHDHRQAMDTHLAELHRKVDHIIEHSSEIPELPPKEQP